MSSANFIGYSRNRFEKFKKEKVRIFREKNGWFAKNEDSSLTMNSTVNNFSICESGTIMALDLLYNDNNEKMAEIREKLDFAKSLHRKINQSFKRNERDVMLYTEKIDYCLLKLRECETNIEELKNLNVNHEKKYEKILKKNLLKSHTIKMRNLMKELDEIKTLNAGRRSKQSTLASESEFGFLEQSMDQGAESLSLFEQDQQKKEALELDSEINRIAENVTNLHALFKQMNEVVHEQGQVVDRIDFNIEQALVKTKKGNKHLEKAKEYAESKCAQKCIKFQLACICVMSILLLIKLG